VAYYSCRNGHFWQGRSSFSAGFHPSEMRCPECGCASEPKLKQSSGRRNAVQAAEPPAIAEAHDRFTTLVTEWPCFFTDKVAGNPRRPGHHCWGRKDPHHLVSADWMRRTFTGLSDVELADILYAPVIGVPLCRVAHEAVERAISEHIYWHEVDDEAKEFCKQVDERYGRESMLERLRLECPQQDEAPSAASERSSA
jgi:hypothetical protein